MQSTNQEIEIDENEPKIVQLKGTVVKNNNQVGSVNLSIGFVTSSNATVKFLSDSESSDDDYDENNEKVKYVHKFQAALSQQQNRAVEANNENRKKEITNKKNSRVSFDQCQSKTTKGPSYSSTPTNTRRCNSGGNLNKFNPITNIAKKKNENQELSTIRNEEENDEDSPTIRNEEEEEFLTFRNDDENDSLPHYQVNRVDESIPVNELESFSMHNTSQSLINTKNIKQQSDLSNLQAYDLNKTPTMMPSSSSSRFQHQHTPIPMSKNDDYISKSDISSDDHDSQESLKDDYDHLITLDNQTTSNLDASTLVDDDDDKQLSSTLKERTEQSEQKENFSSFSNNSNKTEKKKLVLTESPNKQSIINSNQNDSVLEAGQSKSPNKRSSDPMFSNKIMDEHYTTARQISTESSDGSASKSASGNVSEKESISSVGQLDEISFIDKNKIASPESRLKDKDEDLEITMKFKHPNNKFSESKFTLYSDEMHKQYSSEMLPNLKADVKRKQSSDEDNQATKVILSLYKTTKDTDGETAIDKEEFLGKYELNLKDNECRKKYKFHDVGKEHLVTVKLSRNYQKPWAKKVDKWTK